MDEGCKNGEMTTEVVGGRCRTGRYLVKSRRGEDIGGLVVVSTILATEFRIEG